MIPLTALILSQFRVGAAHRVVIEVNVPGTVAYNTVLNNVENLCKAFAPKPVDVEIVCHGAGIQMLLRSGNKSAARIAKLQKGGVVFAACSNTMRGRHLTLGQLISGARPVDSGVAEVIRKQEQGWSYLKGAY